MAIGRPRGGARSRRSGTGRREPRGGAEIAEKGESRKHQYYRQVKMLTHHGSALSASPRCNIRLPDLAGNGNGPFESLTVSIRGRVPTRLRRVARWRQRIAAKHTPVRVPGRTAKPFERATRRSRVGTGVGAMRSGCRQSDEKAELHGSGRETDWGLAEHSNIPHSTLPILPFATISTNPGD